MTIDESNLKLKIHLFLRFNNTVPRSRRTNRSRQIRNATRIQNIADLRTEEEQEIAREERRVSMARLCASQSQEQSVRSTDACSWSNL